VYGCSQAGIGGNEVAGLSITYCLTAIRNANDRRRIYGGRWARWTRSEQIPKAGLHNSTIVTTESITDNITASRNQRTPPQKLASCKEEPISTVKQLVAQMATTNRVQAIGWRQTTLVDMSMPQDSAYFSSPPWFFEAVTSCVLTWHLHGATDVAKLVVMRMLNALSPFQLQWLAKLMDCYIHTWLNKWRMQGNLPRVR
jgi:hypothetical protein